MKPPEAFQSEVGSHPLDMSIEKLRANLENMDSQGSDATLHSDHFVTPGSPGNYKNYLWHGSILL